MKYLTCLTCASPLTFEVEETAIHNISADGKYFIDDNFYTHSRRFCERLLCTQCGKEYAEGADWQRNEDGRIVLLSQKKNVKKNKVNTDARHGDFPFRPNSTNLAKDGGVFLGIHVDGKLQTLKCLPQRNENIDLLSR